MPLLSISLLVMILLIVHVYSEVHNTKGVLIVGGGNLFQNLINCRVLLTGGRDFPDTKPVMC